MKKLSDTILKELKELWFEERLGQLVHHLYYRNLTKKEIAELAISRQPRLIMINLGITWGEYAEMMLSLTRKKSWAINHDCQY